MSAASPGAGRRPSRRRTGAGVRHPAPRPGVGPFAAGRAGPLPAGRGADRGSGRRRPAARLGDRRGHAAAAGPAGVRGRRAEGSRRSGRSRCSRPSGRRWSGRSTHGVEVRVLRPAGRPVLARAEWTRTLFDEGDRAGRPDDPGAGPARRLAAAAGYDDPSAGGRTWSSRGWTGSSPFPLLIEAMAELRRAARATRVRHERRREAYMRQTIRGRPAAGRSRDRGGVRRLARAGAHLAAAAGQPRRGGPARRPKRKVTLTWVPWTHERLASASGYGAGCRSPGWYHHLWTAPERTIARWLTKVARALREPRTCRPPAPTSSRRSGWPRRWPASADAAARRADRGHRGDPGGALRWRRGRGAVRHRAPGGRPGPGFGERAGARPCRWRPT